LKRDRERARQERANLKRSRKLADAEARPADVVVERDPNVARLPQSELLAKLAALHQRFEDEQIDFETFEAAKNDLIGQLDVG
jgi:hypothetical protein